MRAHARKYAHGCLNVILRLHGMIRVCNPIHLGDPARQRRLLSIWIWRSLLVWQRQSHGLTFSFRGLLIGCQSSHSMHSHHLERTHSEQSCQPMLVELQVGAQVHFVQNSDLQYLQLARSTHLHHV